MQGITTFLIDMYGVILEESKGNFIPYTYEHFGFTEYGRLTRQFREEQLFTKAGNGEISSETFLTMLGFDNPEYHKKNYIQNYLTLDNEFIAFAEKYYRDYDFVLLSNDVSEWSAYTLEYYGIGKYFKDKIVSGDVKCRKPDKIIYELALERIGKEPAECIFVDNSVKNLDVAEELGIVSILFNRDGVSYTGETVNNFFELSEKIMNK